MSTLNDLSEQNPDSTYQDIFQGYLITLHMLGTVCYIRGDNR
jgi:hypothetical protein